MSSEGDTMTDTPKKVKQEGSLFRPDSENIPKLEFGSHPSIKREYSNPLSTHNDPSDENISDLLSKIENLSISVDQERSKRKAENTQFREILGQKDIELQDLHKSAENILKEREIIQSRALEQTASLQHQILRQNDEFKDTHTRSKALEQELVTSEQQKYQLASENQHLLSKMKEAEALESAHHRLQEQATAQELSINKLQSQLEQADSAVRHAKSLEETSAQQNSQLQALHNELARCRQELEGARAHSHQLQEIRNQLESTQAKATESGTIEEIRRLASMFENWTAKNQRAFEDITDRTDDVRRVEHNIERLLGAPRMDIRPSHHTGVSAELLLIERRMQQLNESLSKSLDTSLPSISEFHGLPDQNVELWITQLKRISEIRAWSDRRTHDCGSSALKGRAAELYFAEEHLIEKTFKGLSKFLRKYFGVREPFRYWVNKLQQIKQKRNESIIDFNVRFQKIILNVRKISKDAFKDDYVMLIYSNALLPDFRLELMRRPRSYDLHQLMTEASRLESTVRLASQISGQFEPPQNEAVNFVGNMRSSHTRYPRNVRGQRRGMGRGINRGYLHKTREFIKKHPDLVAAKRQICCFRCGRANHTVYECFAKYDIDRILIDDTQQYKFINASSRQQQRSQEQISPRRGDSSRRRHGVRKPRQKRLYVNSIHTLPNVIKESPNKNNFSSGNVNDQNFH